MLKFITIIPARGGSKRLPGKNIKELGGVPLIAHSIEYAQRHLPMSEVWVSTDSCDIARVAIEYGARVVERPEELSGDRATTASALSHAVYVLESQGVEFDYVVLLQPTNPLRPEGLISDAVAILEDSRCDALVSFSQIVRKMGRIDDNRFTPWNYQFGQRSQDMESLYYENGLLYITAKEFVKKGVIIPDNCYPMVIDHPFGSIDIDEEADFVKAQFYLEYYGKDE